MPRKYISKKLPLSYTLEDVLCAVTDVKNKNMTLLEAADFYGVPKTNISDRITGKVKMIDKLGAGRPCELPPELEQEIVDCLKARATLGAPCGREELKQLVGEYILNNNLVTRFTDSIPGQDWYLSFMKKHSELTLKKPEFLQKARMDARDPFVIYDFFDIVKLLFDKHNMYDKPAFILNIDESPFPNDPTRHRAIGIKGIALNRVSGGTGKENTSVLGCVAADGYYLAPFIIFKGQSLQARWTSKDDYPGTAYAATTNGYMEEQTFFFWFTEVFIIAVIKLREREKLPDQHVVLFYDGHSSHYSIRIIKAAIENNISLVKLPSHITDVMQPLDKCVFGPIKKFWDQQLVDYAKEQVGVGSGRLSKEKFTCLLGKVWPKGMKAKNIQSGFKETGIFPFDPSKFNKDLFKPADLKAYEVFKAKALKRSASLNAAPTAPSLSPPKKVFAEAGQSNKNVILVEEDSSSVDEQMDIQAKALDLSVRCTVATPEKPRSMVDIFSSKLKSLPQRTELNALKPKTAAQVTRLKHFKYGEVLTTQQVLTRLEEAELAKIAKKKVPKKGVKSNAKKQAPKIQKPATDEDEMEVDDPEPVYGSDTEEDETEANVDDEDFDRVLYEDFVDSTAGSKAEVGNFVLVRFKPTSKESFLFYVGKVIEVLEDDLTISFLRKKNNAFVFPHVEDVGTVPKIDIKKALCNPSERRGYHKFDVVFPIDITIK